MFTAADIQKRIKEKPFVPLRIITSSGDYYDVFHPDLIMVGTRQLFIGAASEENPTVFDRYSIVAIMHITALETLPVPGHAQKNGE